MSLPSFAAFDLLHTPVWIVAPENGELLFANQAARAMTGTASFNDLRDGPLSANACRNLAACVTALAAREEIVEVLSVQQDGAPAPLVCRLSLLPDERPLILFEGLGAAKAAYPTSVPAVDWASSQSTQDNFYELLFRTNSAPMLLIDPAEDGRIRDANLAATRFYGYSREQMCAMHTWEINNLGRGILPVMHEVAKLPGGHKPLNFVHRLADGSTRHVQTYAGPLELDGRRLMLCIVHDITEQKRLEQELEQAALRDALTGLWNRRQFLNLVDSAHSRAERYGEPYSLILVDADHFKAVNDQYGHQAGDELLIRLARTLEERVREADAVCRWGGEEFVVLLPQTSLDGATALAEAIRQTIESSGSDLRPLLTVSIGVAEHRPGEDTIALFNRTDEALYLAKNGGRNQVISAA